MKSYLVGSGEVLGASTINEVEAKTSFVPQIETTTAFDQKEVEEYEAIPFEIEYVEDDEMEFGLEEIQTPGKEGLKTHTYLVTYWIEDIIDKMLVDTVIEDPITQIVSKGTKIIWRELDTPEYGKIDYWRKMIVWATKYDSTCEGCNNTTALGAPVQEGVCAVDPTVIDMYTHFYIPGYGKCQALDVGGGIKGNEIDMAFRDHRTTSWGAGYKEIYLMDNEPY